MNSIRKMVAGVALAVMTPWAAAQVTTLTFDDLAPAGGFFGTTKYKSFSFENATGTGGEWYWATEIPSFPSFPSGGINITPTAGNPGSYDAAVMSSNRPFQLTSLVVTGPGGPVGIELVDTLGNSYFLGPHFNSPADLGTGSAATFFGGTLLLQAPPSISTGTSFVYPFTNTEQPTLWLKEVAFWGEGDTFAVDNIVVNMAPVPEPSAYAMALVGLAGLGMLARRRRQ